MQTVGNAVPGVPSGAMRKHRARKQNAAFGGRNAGDGVPYGRAKNKKIAPRRTLLLETSKDKYPRYHSNCGFMPPLRTPASPIP